MKARKYWILAVVAAMCLGGMWTAGTFAALTEKQYSLTDIEALYVFVQGLTEETKKTGLTSEQIRTDVGDKLNQLGIGVVSEEEGRRLAGSPVLYVNISAHRRERTPVYVYHIDVGLLQKVTLVRDEQIRIMSITWTKGRLGYCPAREFAKSARETVGYLMDKFADDYAAANPKP
jgi:hypothetical protein